MARQQEETVRSNAYIEEESLSLRGLQSIENEIYRLDDNGTKVVDRGPGPYAPIWQVAPATN